MKWFQDKTNWAIGTLFLITCVFVLSRPIVHFPDSIGYMESFIIRSAGYPLFLKLIQFVFGDFFDVGLILIQLVLGLAAIHFFVQTVRKHFSLHMLLTSFLTIALLFPYFFNGKIANNILSEALSYALYLVVITYFIKFLLNYQKRALFVAIPFIFLLLTVRTQFFYLIPLGIVMMIWASWQQKQWKKHRLLIGLYILLPFLVVLTDKTYHKIAHGHFVSTPWTGIHLAAPAYYVAQVEDERLFDDPQEKAMFQKIHAELVAKRLNAHLPFDPEKGSMISQFINNYTVIANSTIFQLTYASFDDPLTENERYIRTEEMTKKMTVPLVKDNFKLWLKLYGRNVLYGFHSTENFILYAFLLLFSILFVWKKDHVLGRISTVVLIASFANVFGIAVGIYTVFRYTFYNDWVIFLVVILVLNELLKKSHKPSEAN